MWMLKFIKVLFGMYVIGLIVSIIAKVLEIEILPVDLFFYAMVEFWYVILPGIGFIVWGRDKAEAEAKRKVAAEAERIKRHKEQDGYQKQLIVFGDGVISCFEEMSQHLKIAEKYLNQAELEFSENAFAPFWDVIEKAVVILGNFDEGVQEIENISSEYKDLAEKCENTPPQFPVSQKSVEKLSVGSLTAKRMQEIVRIAQRNFHFASIYEQRRTNQILVAGFTSLGEALDNMTCKITKSVNDLTDSVNSMTSFVVEANSERAEREETVQEMLDNIQHRRKPDDTDWRS